jgi:hypothetical protein
LRNYPGDNAENVAILIDDGAPIVAVANGGAR